MKKKASKKELKTIIICSIDNKTWERFHNFSWNTMADAESEESITAITKEVQKRNMIKTHYFELVGEDYFNKFKQPYC